MEKIEKIYIKNRKEWRDWLRKNYRSQKGVWLTYYKKHTRKQTVSYTDAVEEAICFGWIDGLIKRIDNEKYIHWSSVKTTIHL